MRKRLMSECGEFERVAQLPARMPITSAEAAVFTGYSLREFERMRAAGTGPVGMRPGGSGKNGAYRYFKEDLEAWQQSIRTAGPAAAPRLAGAFASVRELAEERAFYLDATGRVEREVESATLDEAIAWLGARDIAWLDAVEAGGREWASVAEHRAFNEAVASVLSSAASALASGLAGSEIGEGALAGAVAKPRPTGPL